MVQFVPAYFKVHLGTVNGAGAEIVKSDDDLFLSLGLQHQSRRHHHSGLARHFLPLVPDLLLVEKDHPEMRYFVFFSRSRWTNHTAAECEGDDHSGGSENPRAADRILENHNTGTSFLYGRTPYPAADALFIHRRRSLAGMLRSQQT